MDGSIVQNELPLPPIYICEKLNIMSKKVNFDAISQLYKKCKYLLKNVRFHLQNQSQLIFFSSSHLSPRVH